jgi:hypothetical protein
MTCQPSGDLNCSPMIVGEIKVECSLMLGKAQVH